MSAVRADACLNLFSGTTVTLNCRAPSLCCPLRDFSCWANLAIRPDALLPVHLLGLQSHCLPGCLSLYSPLKGLHWWVGPVRPDACSQFTHNGCNFTDSQCALSVLPTIRFSYLDCWCTGLIILPSPQGRSPFQVLLVPVGVASSVCWGSSHFGERLTEWGGSKGIHLQGKMWVRCMVLAR